MSRPAPNSIAVMVNAPSDFDAGTAFKLIEARRKRLGYIGHEYEAAELYRRR
jgi:hypothetical protein